MRAFYFHLPCLSSTALDRLDRFPLALPLSLPLCSPFPCFLFPFGRAALHVLPQRRQTRRTERRERGREGTGEQATEVTKKQSCHSTEAHEKKKNSTSRSLFFSTSSRPSQQLRPRSSNSNLKKDELQLLRRGGRGPGGRSGMGSSRGVGGFAAVARQRQRRGRRWRRRSDINGSGEQRRRCCCRRRCCRGSSDDLQEAPSRI